MYAVSGDTDVLTLMRSEHADSLEQLVSLLYGELRAAARRQLLAHRRSGDPTPTLATTALVNEAYLKLVDQSRATWRDRAHFLAIASVAMRHILVDRARARATTKRGGEQHKVTLDEAFVAADDQADVIRDIDEALRQLEALDPRLARLVVLRFFGGMTEEETAEVMGVAVRTVQRDWKKARMHLRRALEG